MPGAFSLNHDLGRGDQLPILERSVTVLQGSLLILVAAKGLAEDVDVWVLH